MKCLSLWQPWASLMVHGKKRVETRGWFMRHRGPLLIHAAKTWNLTLSDISRAQPFRTTLRQMGCLWDGLAPGTGRSYPKPDLPFGFIVGLVQVVECYPTDRIEVDDGVLPGAFAMPTDPPWLAINSTERAFGDYTPGRFAILCEKAVAFEKPIPFRGAQGVFDVPDELVREAA